MSWVAMSDRCSAGEVNSRRATTTSSSCSDRSRSRGRRNGARIEQLKTQDEEARRRIMRQQDEETEEGTTIGCNGRLLSATKMTNSKPTTIKGTTTVKLMIMIMILAAPEPQFKTSWPSSKQVVASGGGGGKSFTLGASQAPSAAQSSGKFSCVTCVRVLV